MDGIVWLTAWCVLTSVVGASVLGGKGRGPPEKMC